MIPIDASLFVQKKMISGKRQVIRTMYCVPNHYLTTKQRSKSDGESCTQPAPDTEDTLHNQD